MTTIKSTVFSGVIPNSCPIKSQIVEDCIKRGNQLLVIDFHRMSQARKYAASNVTLGDFIPYLSAHECIDLLAEIGGNPEDGFRFLFQRFVSLFQELSQITDLRLLDLESWSMLDLLNEQRPAFQQIRRFLEDNYSALPALDNYLNHVANTVKMSNTDINAALLNQRPLYCHPDSFGNYTDQIKFVLYFLKCILSLFSSDDTFLLFDGFPHYFADLIVQIPGILDFKTAIFLDDFFALPTVARTLVLNHTTKLVLFKHHASESIQQIAELLGTEETHDVTVSKYPHGRNTLWQRSYWNDFSIVSQPYRQNMGYSVTKKTKPRLRTDEIASLSSNEAIVINLDNNDYFILRVG